MSADPFDPGPFAAFAHRLVDLLAEHLSTTAKGSAPVLRWQEPQDKLAALPELTDRPGADALQLTARVIAEANHLHHPGFVGHQVNPPLPMAAALEMVNALLNNGMAVYEMGPLQTAMERRAVQWMCGRLGFPAVADGVLTSGGSLGNLTALLAARQFADRAAWRRGGADFCVLASGEAHYCVDRAVRVLGWGEGGAVPVPTDDAFRLRPEALPEALARAEAKGRRVVAVVANACSTATGSFDPLEPIAEFCRREGLWLHVDGAHGASFLLSPAHRHLLQGIEGADSVVWDAHKMMLLPALITGVLFRDRQRSCAAFAQDASYLFAGDAEAEWFNLGHRTLECTKRGMGVLLYVTLATLGTGPIVRFLDRCVALARALADLLAAARDFELALQPEANIVCFRHRPAGVAEAELDAHQQRVRRALLGRGRFYVVQVRLPRGVHLRCTLINPRTTAAHLEELLDEIRQAAVV